MKTLSNFQVVGFLTAGANGPEAKVGDEIRLFLNQEANPDFPIYIDGIIQNPVTRVDVIQGACTVEGTNYVIEYDETDLAGAATEIDSCDVIEAAVIDYGQVLYEQLGLEIEAREAAVAAEAYSRETADTALQNAIDAVQDDLDTWDVLELEYSPVDQIAGTRQVETQTAVGTIISSGTVVVTVTSALLGTPLSLNVSVTAGDSPTIWAAKAADALEANGTITTHFDVDNMGPEWSLTAKIPAANDATFKIAYSLGTATGITPSAFSTHTVLGVAPGAGTDGLRIGQHARYGKRLFVLTSMVPMEWTEITTEFNSLNWRNTLTGFTGGGATKLDSLLVTTRDIGRVQLVVVDGFAYVMELVAGTDAESSPDVIRPNNYLAVTNEVVWVLRYAANNTNTVLDATDDGDANPDKILKTDGDGKVTVTTLEAVQDVIVDGTTLTSNATSSRANSLPDHAGTLALEATVVPASPLTGGSITASAFVDQTHYLTPADTISTQTFNLPTAANSRVGQVVRVFTTKEISGLTLAVTGGGTLKGYTAPFTLALETGIVMQCVSVASTGTWIKF